jgi:ABC transporter substrate binding protein
MIRRQFITLLGGAAAMWPIAARAQRSGKIARIGYLSTANPRSAPNFAALEQRLRELGYIDGQNVVIEYRDAEGEVDRLPDLAADLVRLDVDVIITATDPATRAAKGATTTIPVVMIAINYDPIAWLRQQYRSAWRERHRATLSAPRVVGQTVRVVQGDAAVR